MFKKVGLIFLLLLTGFIFVLISISDQQPPKINEEPLSSEQIEAKAKLLTKADIGIHNVVLQGTAFQRGQQYGYLTQKLIKKQEKQLIKKLEEIFPYKLTHYMLSLFSMGWFYTVRDLFEKEWLEEMYGVSLYAPSKRIYFASSFARQITYHGIHEAGQMMVDSGINLGGCTQLALKKNNSWIIGRNFDFEAGSVFDEEKIMKWVFPNKGYPFLSISFAGMIGVVTGINKNGVYIAINAAGTDSYTFTGKPSTLIALKALQYSKDAMEAVQIIEKEPSLISNIFVVADRSENLFVIEKSPAQTKVRMERQSTAVTNHMLHKDWQSDETNKKRIEEQTTLARYQRGMELVKAKSEEPILQILLGLRDKNFKGQKIFGHRGSIDALIASHSTIYDAKQGQLFVSEGPSLAGAFHGFDLDKSFESLSPVRTKVLPVDAELNIEQFKDIKHSLKSTTDVIKYIKKGHCKEALETLRFIDKDPIFNHYLYATAVGDAWVCEKKIAKAKRNWLRALELLPAYAHEIRDLKEKINENITYDSFIDRLSNNPKRDSF